MQTTIIDTTLEKHLNPNLRTTRYLSILCIYLLLIVCVQFALIFILHYDTNNVVEHNLIPQEGNDCEFTHSIVKRQAGGRGWPVCPPGCVKRRKRKGPFGALGRSEASVNPYTERNLGWGWNAERGIAGYPGESGAPGLVGYPGESGVPGLAGYPGESGAPGMAGESGLPGAAGYPGESGAPGMAGEPGYPGMPGSPGGPGGRGSMGSPGGRGEPGMPGRRGESGRPGSQGSPGARGPMGAMGQSGSPGSRGTPGAQGPSGERGPPGGSGYSYNTQYGPSLRHGLSRGDQGAPSEDFYAKPSQPRNETQASELLREFRLYAHPECKDEVNHRALMDTLKDKGKVSFMILIDLKDNEYCIVHS